jgi:8-oxo-dGTP pyrophosphatase MutT (NUDIX family)
MSTLDETDLIRPSSTVIVVRAGAGDPEIFMVRRHEKSSFGSAYAFPGGVVGPEDSVVHEFCQGLTSAAANSRLGVEGNGLDYYSAAVRELFEESGVLLADLSSLDEDLTSVRDALNDGSLNWAEFVTQHELSLDCSNLHYISHWVTPPMMPKRYSTRFFLTELPAGQTAMHCGGELTESRWATAKEMLAAGRRGDVKLHFPTIKTLESIARHKTLPELVDWAKSCVEWGVTSMVPVIIERNGQKEIVLPGDKDYPGAKS